VTLSIFDSTAELYTRALNLVNSGIVVLDAGQRIVLWNGWITPCCARSAARRSRCARPAAWTANASTRQCRLYAAKHGGRNRVVVDGEPGSSFG